AASTEPDELARSFTERLFETLHTRRVGVLERSPGGGFELLGGLERADGAAHPFRLTARDLALAERACQEGNFVAEAVGERGETSLCALPLFLPDRCLGSIVLEVPMESVSFEGSDRRFLDALASEMAVALDRVRLIERERERQREEKARLEAEVTDLRRVVHGSRLAYRSPVMESLLATTRKVARTDTTVLITGESGTGKEMLAHTLHELSERRERPVVVVDCSAISPTLIESELFGHEKGAFTGAHARKPGRLTQADGATVFLDEIGELPLDLQGKLLRFVQEKQLTPVGSVIARRVDVRIIAATNVDLRARVGEAPEVDVDDLQGGFQAQAAGGGAEPASRPRVPAPIGVRAPGGAAPPGPDLARPLRKALAAEIAAVLGSDRAALVPLGKWLTADLILAADHLSEGVSRRGADLLGIPDTTYRRQLQAAERQRTAGLAIRSPGWPDVLGTLEEFIRSRQAGTNVCQWAETCLLAEIEAALPGDAPAA